MKIIFLLILLFAAGCSWGLGGVNGRTITGLIPGVFRFENYSNAENAKKELLRLHPMGSEVQPLVKRLENLDAKCGKAFYIQKEEDNKKITCHYFEIAILFGYNWVTHIYYSDDNPEIKIIEKIEIKHSYAAL